MPLMRKHGRKWQRVLKGFQSRDLGSQLNLPTSVDGLMAGPPEHSNESLRSMNGGEFIDYMSNSHLLGRKMQCEMDQRVSN
jgi:hypothetical protein